MITESNETQANAFFAANDKVGFSSGKTTSERSPSKEISEEIDGLTIAAFTKKYDISETTLWHLIRSGQVVARVRAGEIYVYGHHCPSPDNPPTASWDKFRQGASSDKRDREPDVTINPQHLADNAAELEQPPLPFAIEVDSPESGLVTMNTISAQSPEVALLIDHLSLAKDENREILRLSQDAIKRISTMAEQVLAAKEATLSERNEVIRSKEVMIAAQQEQIERLRADRKQVSQEREKLLDSYQKLQGELRGERDQLLTKTENAIRELATHDAKFAVAEKDIAAREQKIRELQQSYEDLQMLANALADQHQEPK